MNETQLMPDEVLSSKAYILNAKQHIFCLAEHDIEYVKELEQKIAQEEREKAKEELCAGAVEKSLSPIIKQQIEKEKSGPKL